MTKAERRERHLRNRLARLMLNRKPLTPANVGGNFTEQEIQDCLGTSKMRQTVRILGGAA